MQKRTGARSGLLFGVVSLLVVISSWALPDAAQAQVYPFGPGPITGPNQPSAIQFQTVAPVSVCTAPAISGFTPHIYGGELHSFDYYVDNQPGTRYLPLGTTINGKSVDLNYITVWRNVGTNRIKVHVDVPDQFLSLRGSVTIGVSVLQITQGPPPVCPTAAQFHVNLPGTTTTTPTTPGTATPSTPSTPSAPSVPQQPQQPQTPQQPTTPGTTTNEGGPVGGGEQCTELSFAWLVALAILDIIISAILLLYMSVIVRTNARLILAVLVPPVVMLLIWYFLNTCHTHIWFPILAVLLGIAVLTGSGSPETFDRLRNRMDREYKKFLAWMKATAPITSAGAPKAAASKTTSIVIQPGKPPQPPKIEIRPEEKK